MAAPPPVLAQLPSPVRLQRKRLAPVSREWPPPCETGKCSSLNRCSCRKNVRRVALDYYECASLIYGPNAPGMPSTIEVTEVEVDAELADMVDLCDPTYLFSEILPIVLDEKPAEKYDSNNHDKVVTPPRRDNDRPPKWGKEEKDTLHMAINEYGHDSWDKVSGIVGISADDCQRQWLLIDKARYRTTLPDYFIAKRRRPKPPPRPVPHLSPESCCSDMEAAYRMFVLDAQGMYGEESDYPRRDVDIDLVCYEDPYVAIHGKKKVQWSGLPENPPEWKTGERRKPTRTWEPCRYVDTTPERQEAKSFFLSTLSYEICSTTLPPLSFWD